MVFSLNTCVTWEHWLIAIFEMWSACIKHEIYTTPLLHSSILVSIFSLLFACLLSNSSAPLFVALALFALVDYCSWQTKVRYELSATYTKIRTNRKRKKITHIHTVKLRRKRTKRIRKKKDLEKSNHTMGSTVEQIIIECISGSSGRIVGRLSCSMNWKRFSCNNILIVRDGLELASAVALNFHGAWKNFDERFSLLYVN